MEAVPAGVAGMIRCNACRPCDTGAGAAPCFCRCHLSDAENRAILAGHIIEATAEFGNVRVVRVAGRPWFAWTRPLVFVFSYPYQLHAVALFGHHLSGTRGPLYAVTSGVEETSDDAIAARVLELARLYGYPILPAREQLGLAL